MNEYQKYILLKSAIEDLFGDEAWYSLKESNHIPTWKKYAERTLKTVVFSIKDTVEVYDDEWMKEIEDCAERGLEHIKLNDSIDEIIASLAAALINMSFLQIGQMPRRTGNRRKFHLRKGKWKFNKYRSVVYLQSREQKEQLFSDKQYKKIGIDAQQELRREHYLSKSKLSYSEWCKENKKA